MNTAVAVRVAATETVAVETAVTRISLLGKGTVISVPGTSMYLTSAGSGGVLGVVGFCWSCFPSGLLPLIPGGGRKSLGGTTSGLYRGSSTLGTSSTGRGNRIGSGSVNEGSKGGSPKSIINTED